MRKLTAFILFIILLTPSYAQEPKKEILKNDRIAVFYFVFKNTLKEKIISSEDLRSYIFDHDQPIYKFWQANSNGHYHYEGSVFKIQVPLKEWDFANVNGADLKETVKWAYQGDPTPYYGKDPVIKENLTVSGFDPKNFDKIIYLYSSSYTKSAGSYVARYAKDFSIEINGIEVNLPAVSCKRIEKVAPSSSSGVVFFTPKTEKYYPEMGFWGESSSTILHEWGHSLGSNHAKTPYRCDPAACTKGTFQDESCDNYLSLNCYSPEGTSPVDHTYGNRFDFMSARIKYSSLFNARLRDICGLLPASEKTVVSNAQTKTSVNLIPYAQSGAGIRAAIIEIPNRRPIPFMTTHSEVKGKPATTLLNLYIEYRQASSFDINLNERGLISNTKGIMINLGMNDPYLPDYKYKMTLPSGKIVTSNFSREAADNYQDGLSRASWLLDMTPTNSISESTLNQGFEYYNDEWGLTIGNVKPGADGVTFDVTYGKQTGKTTGVYEESKEGSVGTVQDNQSNEYSTKVIAGKTWTTANMKFKTSKSVEQTAKKQHGMNFIESYFYTQDEAKTACQNLKDGNWRVPTYEDFKSLVSTIPKYKNLDMAEFISVQLSEVEKIYPLGGLTGSYQYIKHLDQSNFIMSPYKSLWLEDRYLFLRGADIANGLLNSSGTGTPPMKYLFPCRCVKN